ncbi:MAG TPA: SAM-dependent methyltransferase [Porphyromonadaceae bacterium]|nr:SAM-dependent methyltransferase [Paramuribaculum sp.]HAB40849.1 SAM-dependent methyltransferase [Porphyromonadaceae bacterium]
MSTTTLQPALYLIPVNISSAAPAAVMPQENIETARQIKHFIVENVRTARRFLKAVDPGIDIDSITFTELSEHTPESEVPAMLAPIEAGDAVGVMSEAGCPAVADPGALAVAEAQRRGMRVVPLVGPSSLLLALMGSGFNGQSFAFLGYLPFESSKRSRAFSDMQRDIAHRRQTQIFIETPYRNNKLIAELCRRMPAEMLLCVASDLTGPEEKIITMPLRRWATARYDYDRRPTVFLLFS